MSLEVTLNIMRLILKGIALVSGSGSILLLWASFYDGRGGSYAFVTLAIATAITLGLGEPTVTRPGSRR